MRKERKHYTAEEKVAILRRHLLDKVAVSDLCEELGLQPTVFYRWQKEFFENGAAAFQTPERPRRQAEEKQKRIEFLEKKVQTKDEVLAEQSGERVAAVEASRTAVALEREQEAQGDRIRTAARAASALARRCLLYQPVGHVLLLMQRAGSMQSFLAAMPSAGVAEGSEH